MLEFKGDELIKFSYKLGQVHRAALPNAVRFTLNDSARDMKFKTIKGEAKKSFNVRKPSFFSKFTGYEPAKGFDISKMKSTSGMIRGDGNQVASEEIGQQQYAGKLANKSFTPASGKYGNMRTGKGLVKATYLKLRRVKPITTNKKNFFQDAKKAKQTKRPLLVKKNKRGVLVKVDRIQRPTKRTGYKSNVKTTPIAAYREGGKFNFKQRRPFVNNAAIRSGKLLNANFIKNAKLQIKRFS